MANSVGQFIPARLLGRVGRAREKLGPSQLEPWNWWVDHGTDFLSPAQKSATKIAQPGPRKGSRPAHEPDQPNPTQVIFNQIVYISIKLYIF